MRMHACLLALLLACLLAGCASTGTYTLQQKRERSRITFAELHTGPRSNALDLVQTLRPHWLQVRGPTAFDASRENPVMAYVDGVRLGGPSELRFIPVQQIESLQYLDPLQASARFGPDHVNGAILVTTRVGTTARAPRDR